MSDGGDSGRPLSVRGGVATRADVDALGRIQEYARGMLPRIQGQAEKWIGGLTALTGLLSIAIVVKGPESFSRLVESRSLVGITVNPKSFVIGCMCIGALLIGISIYCAYVSAHGDPFKSELHDFAWSSQSLPIGGLDAMWRSAIRKATTKARCFLRFAVGCSIVGILVLGLAVVVTWTTRESPYPAHSTCLMVDKATIKLADVPEVVTGAVTLTFVSCPPDP